MSSDPFRGYGFVMAPSSPDAVPAPVTLRGGAAKWLTAFDLAEMLYGAVVTAAVLAVVSTHTASVWRTFVAGIVTLLVYWAAHVYTRTLGESVAHPVQSWWQHFRAAALKELPILRGGAPALVIFGVASALGAGVSAAADIAIWATALLLAGVGYLAAHVAGARAWETVLTMLASAGFGLLIALLKMSLH
jgi:hypothetical protein